VNRIYTIPCFSFFIALFLVSSHQTIASAQEVVSVSGDLQQWHKVTLNIGGPEASEDGDPNPFMDYRLDVTFDHPETGLTYKVPGYFAADGDAANTSASSGNKWRAHLSPDHVGEWNYTISFRKGAGIAVSDDAAAGEPVESVDGLKGSFVVDPTDKSGRDFRGKGRLGYVGKHHLKFAGNNEFFLKAPFVEGWQRQRSDWCSELSGVTGTERILIFDAQY